MPPTPKRNACVILYDLNTSPEFQSEAKQCLLNICASKMFLDSKDTTQLILLNSGTTQNRLNDSYPLKALNIYEATEEIFYDSKLISEALEGVEKGEADWSVGLAVALECIENTILQAKGVMNIQLLFISDFTVQADIKQKRIDFVVDRLNTMNVILYVLGPIVKVPFVLSSFDDIRKWSENVEFAGENASYPYVKEIVQKTNKALVCDLQLGEHLFFSYVHGWGLQPWKVPLTIGSEISLSVSTTRFMKKVVPPRILDENKSSGYTWHLSEDVFVQVPDCNVIGGIYIHDNFIPLPTDVVNNFKFKSPRCFKIIAFTERSNISEVYLRGDGSSVVESDKSKAFELLVSVLKKQNKCAIAYRVYITNCKPKLVALVPQKDDDRLMLVELPYGKKMHTNFVEQDLSEAPPLDKTTPGVASIYEYLDKMDITNPRNFDQTKGVKYPLDSSLQLPHLLRLINQRCLEKYTDGAINFDGSNIVLPKLVDDDTPYHQFAPVHETPKDDKKKD